MNRESSSKINKEMAKIEAIIYASGRPVEIERLKSVLKTSSRRKVINLVRELAKRYEARGGALTVEELPEERVALRIREEYSDIARAFASKPLLKPGPLKTLSYIAYNEPVELGEVVLRLGRRAQSHIKTLEEMALIMRERSDKGVFLRTTNYFAEYFRLGNGEEAPKQQLRRLFEALRITKLENGDNSQLSTAEKANGLLASTSQAMAYPPREVEESHIIPG